MSGRNYSKHNKKGKMKKMDRTSKASHEIDDMLRDMEVNDQKYVDLPPKRLMYFYSLVKFKGFNYRLALAAVKNKTYDELNGLVKLDIDKYVSMILPLMDKHFFKNTDLHIGDKTRSSEL